MTKKEKWKNIKNYEGLFQISSFGRVRSVNKKRFIKSGYIGDVKGRILKTFFSKREYERVCFGVNGKKKNYSVARLVIEAFKPNRENKPQINHIDANKKNNRIENLEWVTGKENREHAKKLGLYKKRLTLDIKYKK